MTTVTTVTLTVDPASIPKEKLVEPSLFYVDSSLAGGTDPTPGGFSDLTGSDFLVGAIRTMVDEFAPPSFFTSIRGMKHDQLFTDFNVEAARQMSLSAKGRKIENLTNNTLLLGNQVTEAIRLRAEAYKFEAVEKSLQDEMNALKERNANLEKERNALDVKVTKLEASAAGKERELADLNALVTSIKSENDNLVDRVKLSWRLLFPDSKRRWLLTHGMELAIVKCLNFAQISFCSLGQSLEKAIEKGMQDGLAAGIAHGKKGTVLTDVAAHNPSAEVDYVSALQQLQPLNFPLLAELKSNKDASVKTVMDILHLEGPLLEKARLNELQPNVDPADVPIHQLTEQVVIGVLTLVLAWMFRVPGSRKSGKHYKSKINSLGFFLTVGFVPIFVDDYEVVGANDQAIADGNANPFPNVDDAELNIPQ
ncbi:hypothetical protein Tco_0635862 [Tanacetum coccineum]